MTITDIAWSAGFLEGEGCVPKSRQLVVSAKQCQRWPLERIAGFFGGRIKDTGAERYNPNAKPCHEWQLCGPAAAALLMTIYPLMSPVRQQQIRRALIQWRDKKLRAGYSELCPRGHAYTAVPPNKNRERRRCHECRRRNARVRWAEGRHWKQRTA